MYSLIPEETIYDRLTIFQGSCDSETVMINKGSNARNLETELERNGMEGVNSAVYRHEAHTFSIMHAQDIERLLGRGKLDTGIRIPSAYLNLDYVYIDALEECPRGL